MSGFQEFLEDQLKNNEFKKEWENIQPEMDVIRAMVDARISQNLTQKELAERTGINQADISKLENGTRNSYLKKTPKIEYEFQKQFRDKIGARQLIRVCRYPYFIPEYALSLLRYFVTLPQGK